MRKLFYPILGTLLLAAAWIALYGSLLLETNDPGSHRQLLKPVALASSAQQTVVGPNVPADTSPEENVTAPPSLFRQVSAKSPGLRPTNRTITSNGTILFVHEFRQLSKTQYRPQLVSLRFQNENGSLQDSTCISNGWWHDSFRSTAVGQAFFPQLATDPGSKRFAGHVYCVWSDGNHDEGTHIFFASSPDHGASWSQPTILSELPGTIKKATVSIRPSVAVNRDGVVAVSWYDRPSMTGSTESAPDEWNVRFRASLDGGATWLSSVQVNEKPSQCDVDLVQIESLSASKDGRFHPAWIDNRNENRQLQTATVEVKTASKIPLPF